MSDQQILQASLKLFALYGYDYVSVRQIASEAEVNIGSISYYFQNKIGILQRIADDFYKGLSAVIYPFLEDENHDTYSSIKMLTEKVLEYMYTNLDSSRIVMREITLETERFGEVIKGHNRYINNRMIEFFTRLGLRDPKVATVKFIALTRFPYINPNLFEYYYDESYSPKLFGEYTDIILSSLASEMSL
ncbi:MAG TPA: TetR family transcriptional regulator [Bacillota bacterium]|nr:TetR family transcriptional regulator [Bacillota bacterium]